MDDSKDARIRKPRPLEVLRTRHGGMSPELRDYFTERQRIKKAVRAALQDGPQSVPDLARACGIPLPKAMWHIMAMRRYGEIVEAGERNDYVLYALKPKATSERQ